MTDEKITLETAEFEFERFLEANDLDFDPEKMDEESKDSFLSQKEKIVKAIMKGSLIINDDGEPVFTPRPGALPEGTETLTFHERTGATLIAMDKVKGKNATMQKTYNMMANITQTHPSVFVKMKGSDIKLCEALFALLMA